MTLFDSSFNTTEFERTLKTTISSDAPCLYVLYITVLGITEVGRIFFTSKPCAAE